MKKVIVCVSGFISFMIIVSCVVLLLYYNGIKAVGKDGTDISFEVVEGKNYYTVSSDLYEAGLIKSEFWYKVYIKLNKPSAIKKGVYILRKNMTVSDIVNTLSKNSYDPNVITLTFKEGYNFYDIIDVIVKNTNVTEEDIDAILHNEEYINGLINKYWFINEDIKNDNLYYSLEGYLYPNTYQFKNEDVSVEDIFNILIMEMDKKLEPYKDVILESSYTPHQLLTLASIVELEGVNKDDRKDIAGVFYNRLEANMNLGSDVTTYYGSKVRMSERDLKTSELNDNNGYNTRASEMAGKLPIGPICNPSIEAIEAVLYPNDHDYLYFVSDKNKKTYFTKSLNEHNAKIAELKKDGLWYEY